MHHAKTATFTVPRKKTAEKVRKGEDAWRAKNSGKVSPANSPESVWRNRANIVQGREAIVQFLKEKWARALEYRLIKDFWAFAGSRIAMRCAYGWRSDSNQWLRPYGNENWEFNNNGLIPRRIASIHDLPIPENELLFHRAGNTRASDQRGLSELGL
ncbi:DUF1348 family protein [Roseobacter insulae]|uniref:DUF1348 family protein n=1 Tax=Roseobacter insulae TaxID=2859783 RepID=UPI0027E57676|nr:DUF1348 family protein [Roseobacter insulae]